VIPHYNSFIYKSHIIQYNYSPANILQRLSYHISYLSLVFSTFPFFSTVFTAKIMANTSIEEVSTEDFRTWTFGPDDSITLHTISFGRMRADFFFCEPFSEFRLSQDADTCLLSTIHTDSEIQISLGSIAGRHE